METFTSEVEAGAKAERLFAHLATKSSLNPIMCQKTVVIDGPLSTVVISFGTAAFYGVSDKPEILPTEFMPAADVAVSIALSRQSIEGLIQQLNNALASDGE